MGSGASVYNRPCVFRLSWVSWCNLTVFLPTPLTFSGTCSLLIIYKHIYIRLCSGHGLSYLVCYHKLIKWTKEKIRVSKTVYWVDKVCANEILATCSLGASSLSLKLRGTTQRGQREHLQALQSPVVKGKSQILPTLRLDRSFSHVLIKLTLCKAVN